MCQLSTNWKNIFQESAKIYLSLPNMPLKAHVSLDEPFYVGVYGEKVWEYMKKYFPDSLFFEVLRETKVVGLKKVQPVGEERLYQVLLNLTQPYLTVAEDHLPVWYVHADYTLQSMGMFRNCL